MVESHSINFKLYLEESFKSSNSQFIRIETAFLLSGELYIATIKLDTDSINSLGLESKVDALPNTLSGGQQQRVAIARALVARPAIILADEPTGNLDSKTSDEVMSLLKTMIKKYNQTLVMITHDETIAQMADRVIYIEDGKVVKDGVTND